MNTARFLAFVVCVIIGLFIALFLSRIIGMPTPLAFLFAIPMAAFIGRYAVDFLSQKTDGSE